MKGERGVICVPFFVMGIEKERKGADEFTMPSEKVHIISRFL